MIIVRFNLQSNKMKITIYILLIVIFLWITQFSSNSTERDILSIRVPKDFIYDGCSMFPDGNYSECCTKHDIRYFTWGDWRERLTSDNNLYQCVKDKRSIWHKVLAPIMWTWVRIGWAPIFPTSFRWGFWRDKY